LILLLDVVIIGALPAVLVTRIVVVDVGALNVISLADKSRNTLNRTPGAVNVTVLVVAVLTVAPAFTVDVPAFIVTLGATPLVALRLVCGVAVGDVVVMVVVSGRNTSMTRDVGLLRVTVFILALSSTGPA
jgi:hypothetical protein